MTSIRRTTQGPVLRDPARWSNWVAVVGGVSLVLGSLDPMEGSVLILFGTALLALASYFAREDSRTVAYRTWSFVLVAVGVVALLGLSAIGGVGANTGRSIWWSLLILPYLVGWSLDLWGPGSRRWLSVSGVAIGAWYIAILGMMLWRTSTEARPRPIGAAVAIAVIGVGTIVACGVRLRKESR